MLHTISIPEQSLSEKKIGLSVISCGLERNPDLKGLQEQFNIGATAPSTSCIHLLPAELRSLVYNGICFSQVGLKLLVGKIQITQFLLELHRNCSWFKKQINKQTKPNKNQPKTKPLSSSEQHTLTSKKQQAWGQLFALVGLKIWDDHIHWARNWEIRISELWIYVRICLQNASFPTMKQVRQGQIYWFLFLFISGAMQHQLKSQLHISSTWEAQENSLPSSGSIQSMHIWKKVY